MALCLVQDSFLKKNSHPYAILQQRSGFMLTYLFAQEDNEEQAPASPSAYLEKKIMDSRTLFISGEITQELAQRVGTQLLLLQELSDEPITIFINSQGGHVEAGDTIHDIIQFIRPEVTIIGTGWVASAGVTIYLSVPKERRLALPNTRFMIHQVMGGIRGVTTDIEIETREVKRMSERLNRLISEATGQPLGKVTEDTDRNYWLTNEEAVEYGIVGRVVRTADEV